MGKITGLLKSCFGRCKVAYEQDEDFTPILARRHETSSFKRPPRFPNKISDGDHLEATRPKSPFEKRLKLLGEKIEAEVQKECNPSRQSVDSPLDIWSGQLLNTSDSIESSPEGIIRSAVVFPSLEALEADCYRTLVEHMPMSTSPVCYRCPSSCSSTPLSSPRYPSHHHQYLFYEDEEDVVMEFLPSLQEIRQIC